MWGVAPRHAVVGGRRRRAESRFRGQILRNFAQNMLFQIEIWRSEICYCSEEKCSRAKGRPAKGGHARSVLGGLDGRIISRMGGI